MMEMGSSLGMPSGSMDDGSKGTFPSLSAFAIPIHALLNTSVDDMTVYMNNKKIQRIYDVNFVAPETRSFVHTFFFFFNLHARCLCYLEW